MIAVVRGSTAATCPVRALKAWLQVAGISEGAIFSPVRKGGRVLDARLSDATECWRRHRFERLR
jgi:hypothetical protein